MSAPADHPLIGDYGLIGDCPSAALVSREASTDWCCLPRFDSGSCFGRLLDRERGGYCSIRPLARSTASFQSYLEDTLVLSGRPPEAGAVFDRALSTANHVGLFSEQYGPEAGAMLGNFPQGLTHYAHIAAARALARQPAEVGAEEGTRAT
jgi:GH15 family glucan-1,4-alpha-glucosidase